MVKNPPASAADARDTDSILGQEDPREEGTATRPSSLAWRIPWTEKHVELQFTGSQRGGWD